MQRKKSLYFCNVSWGRSNPTAYVRPRVAPLGIRALPKQACGLVTLSVELGAVEST